MACRSRHLIVHCEAPSSVLGDVISVNAHEHEHAFADLAHDLLVDGHARALDALQHEAHCGGVCCEEQQELRARQRSAAQRCCCGVSVQLLAVMCRLGSVKRSAC